MEEPEIFYDKVKHMNGVLRVTIPYKLAKFVGLEEGDNVKVLIKKINEGDTK